MSFWIAAIDGLIGPFIEFDFMRRALVGGLALAVSGACLGVFLLLRRMSLMGDALACGVLPGIALAYRLAGLSPLAMMTGGVIAGLIVALGAGLIARFTPQREDASLAALYLTSLALGVALVSSGDQQVDLIHLLFGSVLALDDDTLLLIVIATALNLVLFAVIYRPLVMDSVDPGFLPNHRQRRTGVLIHSLFLTAVVIHLVASFYALGTVMAVGLLMIPAAAAGFWVSHLLPWLALALVFAVISVVSGLIWSFHYSIPSGPAIVLVAGGLYALSLLFGPHGGLISLIKRHRQG